MRPSSGRPSQPDSHRVPLPAPISGESVVAMRGGPLILGGLDSSSASVSGVFQLDAGSGQLHETGALSGPLHDAAAVVLGDQVLVFGGGTETSTDAVQALPAPGGAIAAGTTAHQVGHLPTVRSDLSAVTVGGRAYVLGGYDGSEPIDSVLQTADGSSFTPGRHASRPRPLHGGGRARRPDLRLRWRDRERRRQRRDPGSRPPGGNRPHRRTSPSGALPRGRRRPRRPGLRIGRRHWRLAERRDLALRPRQRQGGSRPAGSPSRSPVAPPPRSARPPT